jgi:hypothetical protein
MLRRRAESDHVAIRVDACTLALPPLGVLGQVDRNARSLPHPRKPVSVLDEEICGGTSIAVVHNSEMNLNIVEDGKAVSATFVLPGGKAESRVVRQGGAKVTDREDRCDSLCSSHAQRL